MLYITGSLLNLEGKKLGIEIRGRCLQHIHHIAIVCVIKLKVCVHPHSNICIPKDRAQQLCYKPCTVMDNSDELPLKWFECQSMGSKRIAFMVLQASGDDTLNVIWCGDIFAYRGKLNDNGAQGVLCVSIVALLICIGA